MAPAPPAPAVREAIAAAGLKRQALHAAVLGFRHPITGEALRFETAPPADMVGLGDRPLRRSEMRSIRKPAFLALVLNGGATWQPILQGPTRTGAPTLATTA